MSWKDWSFEGEYLVSPNGDRFSENCVMACLFVRQMETYKDVMYGWGTYPEEARGRRDLSRSLSLPRANCDESQSRVWRSS